MTDIMADGSPTSMSAAAQQYQEALHKYEPRHDSNASLPDAAPILNGSSEVGEAEIKQEQQQSPAPAPSQGSTPAAAPMGNTSASTPVRPAAAVETASPAPPQPAEHGAPFRRYLNSKVTPSLLEGMKQLGMEQPGDPLRFLGEYLLRKSKELEGT